MTHIPVLLKETIRFLDPKKGDTVLDATINGGGHAREILQRIGWSGKLVGIDQDEEILKNLKLKNAVLLNGNFKDVDELLKSVKIDSLDAALFDLGMSSLQLEESGRGFSFQKNEPLIMSYKSRLGPEDLTAKEILNKWQEKDIYEILKIYGEEKHARIIAKKIVEFRERKSFNTTPDLIEAIEGKRIKGRHSATKTFQALRIAVNDELNILSEALIKTWDLLKTEGRLVVISFHSLEDRIVKNFFRDKKNIGEGILLTKKPVKPSDEEVNLNPRSRSAKLRAIIKT